MAVFFFKASAAPGPDDKGSAGAYSSNWSLSYDGGIPTDSLNGGAEVMEYHG